MFRKMINEVKLLATGLGSEQTQAGLVCPFCDGGQNRDRCFSITKKADGAILYICHRNSCNKRGRVADHPSTLPIQPQKQASACQPFSEPTVLLTDSQLDWFNATYGLTRKEISYAGFQYCPSKGKFVQPVYGPGRAYRGVVLRDYTIKEVKSYRNHLGEPWMGWYVKPDPLGMVIVEDQLSALKASRYYVAAALLNTTFTQDKALEIQRMRTGFGIKKVKLMLDWDARETAILITQRWGAFIEGLDLEFEMNNRDLKYWSDDQLKLLIKK